MKINSGFKDLLQSLNAGGVRYLVVGGYAVMVHTEATAQYRHRGQSGLPGPV